MSIIERAAKRLDGATGLKLGKEAAGQLLPEAVEPITNQAEGVGRAAAMTAGVRKQVAERIELDLGMLARKGYVTVEDPRSAVAEEFRIIKRPLIKNASGHSAAPIQNSNLIMVTSAVPGEGKTTTSVNLAMSIAMELDNTVLLVDADVANPSLPRVLEIESRQGLLDVVSGEKSSVGDVLFSTNVPKLSLVLAGRSHERATEMLASDSMARTLAEMAQRYSDRIIIFDSPPLLVSNEARVLASNMGQILLVVAAESTPQSTVSKALETIEACPVKLLMLNKTRSKVGEPYGSYGSYGGYGASADETGRRLS